jgi:hypothetical protein
MLESKSPLRFKLSSNAIISVLNKYIIKKQPVGCFNFQNSNLIIAMIFKALSF